MTFLRVFLVTFIVTIVLNILTHHSNDNQKTASLKHFVIRAPFSFFCIGTIGMVTPIIVLILALTYPGTAGMVGIPISDFNRRWEILMEDLASIRILFLVFYVISLPLIIAPIKGVWDIIVDNDDITVVKVFIYKRRWKFSEIEYCKTTRGGIKVYVKGRRRKAFFVDAMVEESGNFRKRVEKEGIPIYFPKEK